MNEDVHDFRGTWLHMLCVHYLTLTVFKYTCMCMFLFLKAIQSLFMKKMENLKWLCLHCTAGKSMNRQAACYLRTETPCPPFLSSSTPSQGMENEASDDTITCFNNLWIMTNEHYICASCVRVSAGYSFLTFLMHMQTFRTSNYSSLSLSLTLSLSL